MKKLLFVTLFITACQTSNTAYVNAPTAAFSQGSADVSLCVAGGVVLNFGLDTNQNGALDTSEIKQTSVICNGANAPTTAYTPVSIIDVCGSQGSHDEVMLRLYNGQILASFSDNVNGYNTRFSLVGPGSYVTTDGTSCGFTIDSNLTVIDSTGHVFSR